MSGFERDLASAAMTPKVASAVQDLTTRGWTVVEGCVSDRLRRKILEGEGRINYRHLRQIYDGLPQRIAVHLLGTVVFSGFWTPPTAWARGRPDIAATRAPRDFVPAVDLLVTLEDTPLVLEVLDGSCRLYDDEIPLGRTGTLMAFAPGDLLILDSRTVRRTGASSPARSVGLFVSRDWITPTEDWPTDELDQMPPRAATFFGRDLRPETNVSAWLLRTHPIPHCPDDFVI